MDTGSGGHVCLRGHDLWSPSSAGAQYKRPRRLSPPPTKHTRLRHEYIDQQAMLVIYSEFQLANKVGPLKLLTYLTKYEELCDISILTWFIAYTMLCERMWIKLNIIIAG